jgi:hypothetical protein
MTEPDPRWWKHYETGEWVKCETCERNNAIGVASVPGIPYSAAYCDECIKANAHPWWLLVANQCAIGEPLGDTAPWWQEIVLGTCEHLGRTVEEFKNEVAQTIEDDPELGPSPCDKCSALGTNFIHDELLCPEHFDERYVHAPEQNCYVLRHD